MEQTKLTLTVSEEVIEKAKRYAQRKGRSLSDIVENYLRLLVATSKEDKTKGLTPLSKSLKSSFKAPKGFSYKEELSESLTKKYRK
jgi:BioD-like phosphotransacetylase family protein